MPTDDWKPIKRIVSEYVAEIESLIGRWGGVFKKPHELAALSINPSFVKSAESLAQNMAARVLRSNARSWRSAARKASNGRIIHEALRKELQGPVGHAVRQIILENSRLISSLPSDIAEKTALYIGKRQSEGVRSTAISQELRRKLPDMAASRIRLIARTEVAKSETAITQARAENIGVDWYEWKSAEDTRVRRSHRKMDGVVCAWADPPSPERLIGEPSPAGTYAPGEIYNCRCNALPLIDLDEVHWPHKVFSGGQIRSMTRAQFARMAGIKRAA